MAHLNRRDNDPRDGTRHRVLEAVESTQAKFLSRMVLPTLLAALVGVLVWLGQGALARIDEQGRDITQIREDVRVIGTRLDERVIRQVDDHERRIQALEHPGGGR